MATKIITTENFKTDVLGADHPVLVDFWAEWCGPCKAVAPVLEELSTEFGDTVTIAKLDVDAHPEVAGQFGIRSIPTMILFKNGRPHMTKVGALPKAQLKSWIEGAIA